MKGPFDVGKWPKYPFVEQNTPNTFQMTKSPRYREIDQAFCHPATCAPFALFHCPKKSIKKHCNRQKYVNRNSHFLPFLFQKRTGTLRECWAAAMSQLGERKTNLSDDISDQIDISEKEKLERFLGGNKHSYLTLKSDTGQHSQL